VQRLPAIAALLGLLVAPAAAAGFEVHQIIPPDDRLVPGGPAGTIEVDLDIDCASAWMHDPYTITVEVVSEATVTGPASLQVPMSDCDAPQGITEHIIPFLVTVPMTLPGYENVEMAFRFTSSDHALDAAEFHAGITQVQPDGAPAFDVLPAVANVTVMDAGNTSLTFRNLGNVALNVTWNASASPGLLLLQVPRLERNATVTAQLSFAPDARWQAFTSNLVFVGEDDMGKQSAARAVQVLWSPQPTSGDKGTPGPAGPVPLALASAAVLRRHCHSRETSTDTA